MFRPMQRLQEQFRDAVNAFLARTGTPAARLGARVLRDPSFVSRLRRGRVPTLETADRVLPHIGQAPLGPAFRAEVDSFLRLTGTKEYLFGMEAVGDPSFVSRLRKGASPRLDTVERARRWMFTHCDAVQRKAMEARTAGALSPLIPVDAGQWGDTRGKNNRRRGNSEGENDHNNPGNKNGGNASMRGQNQNQQQNPNSKYLDTREAADFLGLSNRTLDRYRVTGEGPVFHKFGSRIRYALADLEAWAVARRMRSTSEDGAGAWRESP